MQLPLTLVVGCLGSLAVAWPMERQDGMASSITDTDILNYALTLEYLERKFYVDGLKNYTEKDFTGAGFSKELYKSLQQVRQDEKAHVDFIATALGPKAIKEPTFVFPVRDVRSFVGLASVLEGVGVSAYLGAGRSIANKDYLTAAGSILTVEARHAAYLRSAHKQKPFPAPYDTPLVFNQVFSLAAAFVKAFAPGTKVPFKPFPALTAKPAGKETKYCAGKGAIAFHSAQATAKASGKLAKDGKVYAVFYSGQETYYVPVEASKDGKDYTAKVPGAGYAKKGQAGPAGQTYVTLSTADGKAAKAGDSNSVAGPAILEIEC